MSKRSTMPDLRSLGEAQPSALVQRRIVRGAMTRLHEHQQSDGRRNRWWALPIAATTVVAATLAMFLWYQPTEPSWTQDNRPLAASTEQKQQPLSSTPGKEPPKRDASKAREMVSTSLVSGAAARSWPIGRHQVWLASRSRLTTVRQTMGSTYITMAHGQARFRVQPLKWGAVFQVKTPALNVEVVGTQFKVEADAVCSHVSVQEGQVRIRQRDGKDRLLSGGAAYLGCVATRPSRRLSAPEEQLQRALQSIQQHRLVEAKRNLVGFIRMRRLHPVAKEALYQLVLLNRTLGLHQSARHRARQFIARYPQAIRSELLASQLKKARQLQKKRTGD